MPISEVIDRPWRTVVLDDDGESRCHLVRCVAQSPAFKILGSCGTLAAAERITSATPAADLLVTKLALPDGDGAALIERVCRIWPSCDCLVISAVGEEDGLLRCIEAGAVGYILKDAAPADIVRTLLAVKAGGSPISPVIARRLLRCWQQRRDARIPVLDRQEAGSAVQLSEREMQVLDLIARGYSYAEVAQLGKISVSTVQTHIKHLYSKLAVHSRSEAVFEASRMGLLPSFGGMT